MTLLHPSAPIAADALLLGDPARAMRLAQELLAQPKMSNHAHGLWGYWGHTEEGRELTVQSIGVGGPSAAMVLAELGDLGVRRAVQVGTCRAIVPDLALGELLAVREAIAADGVGRELGGESPLSPDPVLGAALASAADAAGLRSVSVASTNLLGELDGRPAENWAQRGAEALELTAAALFAAAPRCGVAVASLMAVSEAGGETISDQALEDASAKMGPLALAALSTSG